MKTRRRGVSALIEHRRQDDWTYTPCTCGGSGCSGGCDVLAGERMPKQRPQDEEHPDQKTEEHFGARFPHQGEEAGSVVFHSSSNTSEIKNDNNEARVTAFAAAKVSEDLSIKDAEILRLIKERRSTPKEEKQRLEVRKCKKMYQRQRMKRQMDIQRILEDFKGVRNIPGIKSAKKRVLVTKIKNEKGDCITSRKGIADVFGEFYKKLYKNREKDESAQELGADDNNSSTDVHNNNTEETARIPEITTEELQTANNKLKKGKSPDSKGIRAEDIKACDDETREMVRQIFNEIIKRNEFTPEDWKKVTIKVIHQKGDVENVSNYRPICSLPALYKLFSTILNGRLYPVLDQKQAEDQAGFRKSYQTTNRPPCNVQIG